MKTKLTTALLLGASVVAAAIGISALAQPESPAGGSPARPRPQLAPGENGGQCPAQGQSAENGSPGDREFLVREGGPPDDRPGVRNDCLSAPLTSHARCSGRRRL